MKVTVLGYWGAYPWNNEGTSSYLLESEGFSLLVDAGSSTLNVLQQHLDPLMLDAVIISHYHHDHIADLGVLQYYRQLHQGAVTPELLPIYGHMEEPYFANLSLEGVSIGVGYREHDSIIIGPFRLTFLRTVHPVVCFAMRIEEIKTGKVLVYTADSGYFAKFNQFVAGADILIADAYLFKGNEQHPAHFTSHEVGLMAAQGGVKQLILSHLAQGKDLTKLLQEAKEAAGAKVSVCLAEKNLIVTI